MPPNKSEPWPLGVRIIHWILAVVLALNWFVLEEGDAAHRYFGYLAFLTVVVRLAWGVWGRGPASFRAYPKSFSTFVYFVMWIGVLVMGVSGFMQGLDAFWGDERLENIHVVTSKILIFAVVIHLGGIAFDAIRFRRPTWMTMIDGKKRTVESGVRPDS